MTTVRDEIAELVTRYEAAFNNGGLLRREWEVVAEWSAGADCVDQVL